MKIIDILNKLANNEEIPKFKWNSRILTYNSEHRWFDDENDDTYCRSDFDVDVLNDKVKIIGEKIKKEELSPFELCEKDKDSILNVHYEVLILMNKLNEVIDKVNEVDR